MEQFRAMELCVLSHSSQLRPSPSEVPIGTEEHQALVASACKLAGIAPSARPRFPGAQPNSIRRSELHELRNDYLVALKSDGVRYLLLLTRYEGVPRAVMIDRLLRLYEVEVWANDDYFDGTLFDGELLWDYADQCAARLLYLVFDVYHLRGRSCRALTYAERVEHVHRSVLSETPLPAAPGDALERFLEDEDKVHAVNNPHALRLLPKRVLPAREVGRVWGSRRFAAHMNDGLIFTPLNDRQRTFKWKLQHTIDLLFDFGGHGGAALSVTPSVRALQSSSTVPFESVALERGAPYRVEPQRPNNQMVELVVKAELEAGRLPVRVVLECLCDVDRDARLVTLLPIKRRTDKTDPNSVHTATQTLHNVLEDVSCADLCEALGAHPQ